MVTEGAIGDWSGIYLRQDLGSSAAAAATGFTGFSAGMAVARLGGDWLNERLGAGLLLRGGMALVAVALGAVLLIGEPVPAVIGFGLVGLGIANAVPILFSAAGRHEPSGPSLAAVFTVGYTGFIVGPPMIGALGDTIGLPETLGLLCLVALSVTVLGAGDGRAGRYSSASSMSRRISPAASMDAGRELAPVGVGDRAVGGQHLGEAGDDRQRRAQVVAQLATRLGVRQSRRSRASGRSAAR